LETSDDEEEIEEQATVLAPDLGEKLVLRRIFIPWRDPKRKTKENIVFTHGVPSKVRYVL